MFNSTFTKNLTIFRTGAWKEKKIILSFRNGTLDGGELIGGGPEADVEVFEPTTETTKISPKYVNTGMLVCFAVALWCDILNVFKSNNSRDCNPSFSPYFYTCVVVVRNNFPRF